MKINEFLKLKNVNTSGSVSRKFIDEMYSRYPQNPFNRNEFGIVYGEGEDQQVAFFDLRPGMRGDNWVEIYFIHTVPHKVGVGTRAMKELQSMAKTRGIKLSLMAWDKGAVSQYKLKQFYTKLGFKPIKPGANSFTWE